MEKTASAEKKTTSKETENVTSSTEKKKTTSGLEKTTIDPGVGEKHAPTDIEMTLGASQDEDPEITGDETVQETPTSNY